MQAFNVQVQYAESHQRDLQELRSIVSQSTEVGIQRKLINGNTQPLREPKQGRIGNSKEENSPASSALSRNATSKGDQTRRRQRLLLQFRTPWFLGMTRMAFEFYSNRAPSGWDFSIKTYNIVSMDAPIFKLARGGDVGGMRKLLDSRQASPFDLDVFGITPLYVRQTSSSTSGLCSSS